MNDNPSIPVQNNGNQRLTKRERRLMRKFEKQRQRDHDARRQRTGKFLWILLPVILVVLFVWWVASKAPENATPSDLSRRDVDDPFLGGADAAVIVREYADFQCPACAQEAKVTRPVIDKYGDRIKYVYNDFPLSGHKNALLASNAAECANAQGKFWDWHDLVLDKQTEWSNLDRDAAATTFASYASSLDLDAGAFSSCLQDQTYRDRIQQDMDEGEILKVRGTPTIFIGDTMIDGVPSAATFEQKIEEALSAVAATPGEAGSGSAGNSNATESPTSF